MSNNYLDVVWGERPDQIRRYYELLPLHERLCSEVSYNIEHLLKEAKVEYAHVMNRAKTLSSFCEKIYRKNYKDPANEITDLAGVRIVFLYISDSEKIEQLIEDSFEIIEKVDKIDDQGVERFGYNALHYLVKIRPGQVGVRFGDLHNLVCEIQVRTALQDAWALVAHHLSYKQESDIPKELRRKLNALSGLFETADDQLKTIRDARLQYQNKVESDISKSSSLQLKVEINLDNLMAYIHWRFPKRKKSHLDGVAKLLNELKSLGYKTLAGIDETISRSLDAVLAYEQADPPEDEDDEPTEYVGVGLIRTALAMVHDDYCDGYYGGETGLKIKRFRHLVK